MELTVLERLLLDALQALLEEAKATSAYEDAQNGEDDAMLKAVERAEDAVVAAGENPA